LRTRLVTPGREAVYHISSCLAGKQALWGEAERGMFRRQLGLVAEYCGVVVLNYTILVDHFHLLVRVPLHASRQEIGQEEMLRRIALLHADSGLAPHLGEALSALELRKPGTVAGHFTAQQLQRGGGAVGAEQSAYEWALGEMERHRQLMADLPSFLRLLKQRFSKWFNATHDRFGTLWADRFRSLLVEDTAEAVQAVSAYIDLNAVRLGMVEDPTEYEFCGAGEARRAAGLGRSGIQLVVEHGERDAGSDPWAVVAERHRSLLWGDLVSATGVENGVVAVPGKPRCYAELPLRISRSLVLADLLRDRQPIFQQGLALGTESFVQRVFRSNRAAFGADGTYRGDWLRLRSGLLGFWVVRGLQVLKHGRFDSRVRGS
jgi:putative transposase